MFAQRQHRENLSLSKYLWTKLCCMPHIIHIYLFFFHPCPGHLPVHPGSTHPMCLVWNFSKVLDIISAHRSVVCFLAGHEHDGRYYLDKDTGVHHVTFEAVIETPPNSNAFGIVYVFKDRMVLKGSGRVADRVLHFPGYQGDDQCDHHVD